MLTQPAIHNPLSLSSPIPRLLRRSSVLALLALLTAPALLAQGGGGVRPPSPPSPPAPRPSVLPPGGMIHLCIGGRYFQMTNQGQGGQVGPCNPQQNWIFHQHFPEDLGQPLGPATADINAAGRVILRNLPIPPEEMMRILASGKNVIHILPTVPPPPNARMAGGNGPVPPCAPGERPPCHEWESWGVPPAVASAIKSVNGPYITIPWGTGPYNPNPDPSAAAKRYLVPVVPVKKVPPGRYTAVNARTRRHFGIVESDGNLLWLPGRPDKVPPPPTSAIPPPGFCYEFLAPEVNELVLVDVEDPPLRFNCSSAPMKTQQSASPQ